jgi:hypothetical protein
LNRAIGAHLYRIRSDVARTFSAESHTDVAPESSTPFVILEPIVRAVKCGDISSALAYACRSCVLQLPF